MAYEHFAIERRDDGVALVWLDYPGEKINKLARKMQAEFDLVLNELTNDSQIVAAVVISRKPDNFIVGADIDEFRAMTAASEATDMSRRAQLLLDAVAGCPKPIVAAIHGPCLGGGLEVALACHGRIATDFPKTALGALEVRLGILPAAGGTQRLPRTVGLQAGLDMLLTGKTLNARRAKKAGLVDEVVTPDELADRAVAAALRLVETPIGARLPKLPARERLMLNFGPVRRYALGKARAMVARQTHGNYPALPAIIDCVETGLAQGMDAGLAKESALFGELMMSGASRQLLGLFVAANDRKKLPVAQGAAKPARVAVIGAGLMGAGVALASIGAAETPTLLKDVSPAAVGAGRKYIAQYFEKRVARGSLPALDRDRILSRLDARTDYQGVERAELVIEAVFEDLALKRRVLAEVEAVAREDCVFASNTSALPIAEIAAQSKRPENVIGMHYFSPVPAMPLLEIIVAPKTSERALRLAAAAGLAQGKTIIVVKDGPGFYTTRILASYLNEAGLLLEGGASIEDIDAALADWGFPFGPVRLFDEIGLDVGAHVGEFLGGQLTAARGGTVSTGVAKMFAAGFLGKKNKLGFYGYDAPPPGWFAKRLSGPKKKRAPNPDVYQYFGGPRPTAAPFAPELLQQRAAFAMVNEAALALQEGVIAAPVDGDLGAVLGLGFPPFRGGPFRFLDAFGAGKFVDILEQFAQKYGAQFKPAQLLVERAKQGTKFY